LRVKDLVVQRHPSSLAGASEYGFRHVLIRDVAYDSLPKRDRSRLHRDIAAWAERELADRVDEFAELIADHLSAALAYEQEFRSEDDDDLRVLRGLTQRAALRAARRAAAVSQMAAAARWLRLTVDLARQAGLPPREMAALAHEYADVAWENADARERDVVLSAAIDGLAGVAERSTNDDDLLAALREQRGQALYEAGEVDASGELLRAAIADLEPGPATPARAALLNRLGWVTWRRGDVEDAVRILERAILEATTAGDDRTCRWASANLGAAFGFLGRGDEAVTLLEDAFRQARDAGDRALLLRCYINLPATRYGRGDPLPPLIALADEGLVLARRAAARHTLSWLAGNRAEFSRESGCLDEALAHADEAVYHAPVISPSHQAARLLSRAIIRRLRGEPREADDDVDEASRISGDQEPQVAALLPQNLALRRWAVDPGTAAAGLAAWCEAHQGSLGPRNPALQGLARMALRLDAAGLLVRAAELHRATRDGQVSVLHAARDGWIDGLAARDLAAVEAAAAVFDARGYRASAADAWADAALMAARLSLATEAERRAAGLYREMGMHPLLGWPPETRWLPELGVEAGQR
jgi:tetratricopeptide (TPR) repeat protein